MLSKLPYHRLVGQVAAFKMGHIAGKAVKGKNRRGLPPCCTGCGTGAARLEWRVTVFLLDGTSTEKALKANVDRSLGGVFKKSGVADARAHRFRHTLVTELLGRGASFEDVADILGNSPEIVRKHYAKWFACPPDAYR